MKELAQKTIAEAEFDLYRAGYGWITGNGGVHLQVTHEGNVVVDYWPTTGKVNFRQVKGFNRTHFYSAIRRNPMLTKV